MTGRVSITTASRPARQRLHDPTSHDAVGKHVEVVVVPLTGRAGSGGALEDQRHEPKSTIALRRRL
jgi:hypothetical protein